jgi:SAM-dependent methyltransferase
MPSADSKQRFSSRVEQYVKYRPGYPAAVLDFLRERIGLLPAWIVADIGSGTGISTKLFLDSGNTVFAVEPNREMREAAEQLLAGYATFRSVDGSAEQTTLAPSSCDLVVAGQAFHWFDAVATKAEFARILQPGGWVMLMWNVRRTSGSPFLEAYEKMLLTFGTDYAKVRHENIDTRALGSFFGSTGYQTATFDNEQVFDFEGLQGRLLSSSYAPAAGQTGHKEMLTELRRIFDVYNMAGKVTIPYDTEVHVGRFG